MTETQVQLTPDQAYLKELLDRFNANPEDPSLEGAVKILLTQIREVQQEISSLAQQIETLNGEIREKQQQGNTLVQQIISKQGESQGYINTLLKLR